MIMKVFGTVVLLTMLSYNLLQAKPAVFLLNFNGSSDSIKILQNNNDLKPTHNMGLDAGTVITLKKNAHATLFFSKLVKEIIFKGEISIKIRDNGYDVLKKDNTNCISENTIGETLNKIKTAGSRGNGEAMIYVPQTIDKNCFDAIIQGLPKEEYRSFLSDQYVLVQDGFYLVKSDLPQDDLVMVQNLLVFAEYYTQEIAAIDKSIDDAFTKNYLIMNCYYNYGLYEKAVERYNRLNDGTL